jgi:hypothetical protein
MISNSLIWLKPAPTTFARMCQSLRFKRKETNLINENDGASSSSDQIAAMIKEFIGLSV